MKRFMSQNNNPIESDDYTYFDHQTLAVVHVLAGAAIASATQHLNLADGDEFYRKLFEALDRFQTIPLTLPHPVELTDEQRVSASKIIGILHQAYAPAPPEVLAEFGLMGGE